MLPLVIGLPVLIAIAASLARLSSIRYPYLGWAETIANDGKAVALGKTLYQSPADGYTGMLYPPVFPLILGPLYNIYWWDGWSLTVTITSACALAAIAGAFAVLPLEPHTSKLERTGDVLGGIGIAGLAWWIVSANYRNLLYEGRADQFAWLLALTGLLLVGIGTVRHWPRAWPGVVFLSAAVWTKQTTIGAVAAAVLALTWWTFRGHVSWRLWARTLMGLAVLNVAVLAGLWAITDGWAWYFLIGLPRKHWSDPGWAQYFRELRDLVLLPVSLTLIAAVACIRWAQISMLRQRASDWAASLAADGRAAVRGRSRNAAGSSLEQASAFALLLVLFVACALIPSIVARRKQGGEPNQYIGIMWALCFLFAIGYRSVRFRRAGTLIMVGALSAIIALVHVAPLRHYATDHRVSVPTTYPVAEFTSLPPDMRVYAERHLVYAPDLGGLNSKSEGEVWPAQQNIVDLLAAGEQPGYLINALLERHFDAVAPFDLSADAYASAYGRTEENFLWKLNQVIEAGYGPGRPGVPSGLWVRRLGGNTAASLRTCFGPFDFAGVTWEIRRGGGLWCRTGKHSVTLRSTPAPQSDIRTTHLGRVSGRLSVDLAASGSSVDILIGVPTAPTRVLLRTHESEPEIVDLTIIQSDGTSENRRVSTAIVRGRMLVKLAFDDSNNAPGVISLGSFDTGAGLVSISASPDGQPRLDFAELSMKRS